MFKKLFLLLIALLVLVSCGSPAEVETPGETTPEPSDVAINVYTRDSSSGTREAFQYGIGLDSDGGLTSAAVETSGNGDMATKVGVDANGIGYVSLTTDFTANNLKTVGFEGVEPTIDNVLDQSYTLSRPFAYTTRAADDFENDTLKNVVTAFLDFIHNSKEGLEAVESKGGIVDLSDAKDWSELKANHPVLAGDLSGVTIRTAGSTSVVNTLTAALEAFEADTGVKFVMNHTGSGDGYKRVLGEEKDSANGADIGFASRNFKTEEDTSAALATDYYCLDAVVVVVSQDNTAGVTSLTADQLVSIFGGEFKNWGDIK